jgi:uncharacterized repeat protein (TIGR01451 family)
MIRELVTLSTSDIVRLLGALVLLSLGITLTLWGLKRHRSGAVMVALFLCLVALVPAALAVEIPPTGSAAEIQTTGPDASLGVGDWYTHNSTTGPGYHSFDIYIPCTIAPTEMITVELRDPEVRNNIGFPADQDEILGGVEDDTTFTLTNPSGVVIATRTYTPDGGTDQNWVSLATFTPGADGCGIYKLTSSTSDDDENAWKLRLPDDFDGTPGTGDEISLGNVQTSFQHEVFDCQTFYFFVPVTPSILLSNFDMDLGSSGMCVPNCTVVYTTPSGTPIDGTASPGTEWSGGGTLYPPISDTITTPEAGWWQAELCLDGHNQYIFDTGGLPYFYSKPAIPDMTVSKDDGTTTFEPDGVLNYTITYENNGPGAALDAVLTDTLPLSTTYLSCSGGLSCGYIPPRTVTYSLGTVVAGASGSVGLRVRVDAGVSMDTITNVVELD